MKGSLKNTMLIVVSALAMAMTFAPVNAWILGYLSLIPLLYVFYIDPKKGFARGYLFGLIYSLILVHWLAFNSGASVWLVTLSALMAAAFLALNYGVIGWLTVLYIRRHGGLGLFVFPIVWTVVEFIRSFGTLGFQWVLVANGQTANIPYIQMADLGGPFLISFFLVSVNTLLFSLLVRTPAYRGIRQISYILLGLFLVVPYTYGIIRLYQQNEPVKSHVFRLVQPDYDSHEKWERQKRDEIFETMISLSRAQGVDSVDIIVWPESATPVYIRTQVKYRSMLEKLSRETGSILISGVPDYFVRNSKVYVTNSLYVFEPYQGITGKYNKQKLVPFGEYIPLSGVFPRLASLNLGQGNFTAGKNEPLLEVNSPDLTLAPMICYESVFSRDAFEKIRNGGEYHILVTNDSWFGDSWGPYQHAAQAIFRAIETRRPVVRCANTGISMAIDPTGRILKQLPLNTRGFLDVRMRVPAMQSTYVRSGNAFAFILSGVLLGILLTPLWPVKGKRNDP